MELSTYNSSFSLANKLSRLIWGCCYWILFRPFNLGLFNTWRALIFRIFQAKIGRGATVYASARIWAPWNLELGDYSSIGPKADIYNQGKIIIGSNSVISQKSYLCASTHNHNLPTFPLIKKPINIGNKVWVAADAFIGPGVQIGDGAVIGARSAVFKNVQPWTIVGGNPAEFIKNRILKINGYKGRKMVKLKVRDTNSDQNI